MLIKKFLLNNCIKTLLATVILGDLFFRANSFAQDQDPNLMATDPREIAKGASTSPSLLETFIYDPAGRRDPFQPYREEAPVGESTEMLGPLLPLQRFALSDLKLIGIMWDIADPKALFVDPNGRYWPPVGIDDRVGNRNGYIAAIREGEVVVIESVKNREGMIIYTPKVLRVER